MMQFPETPGAYLKRRISVSDAAARGPLHYEVDVAAADLDGLPGSICQVIALKLMQDDEFQAEIMDLVANRSSSA